MRTNTDFGTRIWDAAMGYLKYGSGFGIGEGGAAQGWKNFEKHDLKNANVVWTRLLVGKWILMTHVVKTLK